MAQPAGDVHDAFVHWARIQGAKINGVKPAKFPGRGVGIVAERDLREGELIVRIPASALLTTESPTVKSRKFPETFSFHCRLAAHLTLNHFEKGAQDQVPDARWEATWPKMNDFEETMPVLWQDGLKRMTPGYMEFSCKGTNSMKYNQSVLHLQEIKMGEHWEAFCAYLAKSSKCYPHSLVSSFRYYWLVVNTRCLWWGYPGLKGKLAPEDYMCLCPFIDYFNHTDEGCNPVVYRNAYIVRCNRDYKAGDEVFVTYHRQDNDFLLVEYGFVLEQSNWDGLSLDHMIIPNIVTPAGERLKKEGFFGKYYLDASGLDLRAEYGFCACVSDAALKTRIEGSRMWTSPELSWAKEMCLRMLREYEKEIGDRIKQLKQMAGAPAMKVLLKRLGQVDGLIRAEVERLEKLEAVQKASRSRPSRTLPVSEGPLR